MNDFNYKSQFPFFSLELVELIKKQCDVLKIGAQQEILRKGQYVKVIPIVLKGLLRIYTKYSDKELLLYHIKPNESCIMSFAAGIKNGRSQVFAEALRESEILVIPVDKLKQWLRIFPELNILFNTQYEIRYSDLLNTIENMVFHKMDERVLNLLEEKSTLTNTRKIKVSHQSIADDLATSREVISRVLKKLEHDRKLILSHQSIEIL